MNIDRLFLRAICKFLDENNQKTIQWEDVVKSCFEMFPEEFSFEKYKEWPDTFKIHTCFWRCRNQRQWIVGDRRVGISLTEIGKTIGSVKLENKIYKDIQERKIGPGLDPRLIKFVKEDPLYKRYLKERDKFAPSEPEIRSLLKTTMETDYKTLKRNMEYLKKVIKGYQEEDLTDFSEKINKKINELEQSEENE